MQTAYSYLLNWLNMAKFKIIKSTTVAELKEQFSSEFGGVLRVYEGRSEAPEDAALVSLGAKEGDLECRASRTVGKFNKAFQDELNLKVKVYTKDNRVCVLDGITLSTVREIPKGATKAKMEQFLASQKKDNKDITQKAKAEKVEIPEEIKGIPLFDIHMKKVEWPFMTKEEIDKHSDELGAFGVVIVCGLHKGGDFEQAVFTGKTDDGMYNAPEFIKWSRDKYEFEHFEADISDSIKIYGLDKQDYELEGNIHQGIVAYTGSEYSLGEWELDTPALFRVQYDENEPDVFSISEKGEYKNQYSDKQFEKLVKLTKAGRNKHKPNAFNPFDYEFYKNGLTEIKKKGKYGFIDSRGNLVVDCIYDDVYGFYNGFAQVKKDNKYGFVNTNGNLVVDCIYDFVYDFCNGFARVKKDNKWGFVDTKGNLVVDCIYDEVWCFLNGFARVKKDNKYGFVNTKGNLVVDCICDLDSGNSDIDGNVKIKIDGKWGFIVAKENLIIDCIYASAHWFCEGFAAVKKNGKWGFINTNGNLVIDCIYDVAESFSDGFAAVEMNGKWGFIDTKGNIVIDCIYDDASNYGECLARVKKMVNGDSLTSKATLLQTVSMTMQRALKMDFTLLKRMANGSKLTPKVMW